MSITGGIVSRYNNDTDADATALRSTVGESKCWADQAPDDTAMPYIVVSQVATAQTSETKGQASRVEEATAQFDVWDTSRSSVESILDLIEDCYIGHDVTITNRLHLSTHFSSRNVELEKPKLYHGTLDLRIVLQKYS